MATDQGWRAYARDGALTLGVVALVVADAVLGPARPGALDYTLLLAGTLPLVARNRAPRTVLLVSLALVFAYTARVEPGPIATTPVLIALYTVVAVGHRVLATVVVVPLTAFAVADNLLSAPEGPAAQAVQAAILPVGWFAAVFVLGEVTRARRAYLRQAEERAAEAERTREEVALRRASEERLRIARELHDSLTHSISVITVQAGVGVHLARKRGEEVPPALLAVQEASQEASRELRATLEVLREPGDAPDIGLRSLPQLVERASGAGVPVTLTVDGPERSVPPEVDRAAYRIVQEALTNVARHANGASATVCVGYGDGTLVLRIDDDGAATPDDAPVPGAGLTGMRERVSALGGHLRAEPRRGGGFTVEAELPLEGVS
ncbi:signal transduction histidine kinase [Prauserella shujinwangii]|uniref:histidine kinase n=1 Tax=Prauserella shujinwangii TaxID=1453103 RepID=A0A2T0LL43_9PSEU|nr:sensor histidine kinase [Prauserella shujinwangii]PRX43680.1 signal transduction histidine kinase [Prauserella shujinwangii]